MEYQEPSQNQTLRFDLIPRSDLKVTKYQRIYSSALAKKLINSVSKAFIMPLVVTESMKIIDGQHRLGALESSTSDDNPLIPCIIVPDDFESFPLFWNIEKTDNIKDKALKIYRLYVDKAQSDLTEKDIAPSVNYEHYIFTIAFSFNEFGLKSPSLVEPPVKKVDNQFLTQVGEEGFPAPMRLDEAIEVRRERAAMVARLEQVVEEVARDYGISDFNLKRAIVSKSSQNLWGNKRKIDESPEEAIPALTEMIMTSDWSWMEGK